MATVSVGGALDDTGVEGVINSCVPEAVGVISNPVSVAVAGNVMPT
jgi:hypothetical protein